MLTVLSNNSFSNFLQKQYLQKLRMKVGRVERIQNLATISNPEIYLVNSNLSSAMIEVIGM